jgi:hypothetical protein
VRSISELDLSHLPRMVRWFSPRVLAKIIRPVLISTIFGEYADRRLIQAALDELDYSTYPQATTQPGQIPDSAFQESRQPKFNDLRHVLIDKKNTGIWIDYVADLGDGFDSTYTIAFLLGQPSLQLGDNNLPRGDLLIMGGDQVYPDASRDEYMDRFRHVYEWASPNPGKNIGTRVPLFMIPGNHDWYDGLDLFLAMFCRPQGTDIGSWRIQQRRSYFAVRLTDDYWIWGCDLQLTEYVDQAQASYFNAIARMMNRGSRIILCTAVPGWYEADAAHRSYESLGFIARIVEDADKDLNIRLVLTGDTHHYCRYSFQNAGIQFITAGGGGAFLHPTHVLRDAVKAIWCNRGDTLVLAAKIGGNEKNSRAQYPSSDISKRLVLRNLWFPVTNLSFAAIIGVIYWMFALLSGMWSPTYVVIGLALFLGLYKYADKAAWSRAGRRLRCWGEKQSELRIRNSITDPDKRKQLIRQAIERKRKLWLSIPHTAAHLASIWLLSEAFYWLNTEYFGLAFWSWWFIAALLAEMLVTGGLVGGVVFGLYLLIACLYFGSHSNEAFSALRIADYRHFLRIRLKDDELTIYPIGVNKTPLRRDWELNKEAARNPLAPKIVPAYKRIVPTLIEGPIVVR